jgi:hypothetical protein
MHGNRRAFQARVVLLGASNCTRAISTIVSTARMVLGSPLDVHAAIGHGRSYGLRSRVLGRALPGIIECRLWGAIGSRARAASSRTSRTAMDHAPVPTFALVADIGNDVMYGRTPEEIIGWVAACVDRLAAAKASILMTQLPMEPIWRVSGLRYRVAKSILFPTRRISHADALARADEVNAGLFELAAARGISLAEMRPEWYGLDPIHIRMRCWPAAWMAILLRWRGDLPASGLPPTELVAAPAPVQWLRLKRMQPLERWVFGRRRRTDQPAGTLPDGTQVSMY